MAEILTAEQQALAERNIPLVKYLIATEFSRKTVLPYEDMVQAGCEGLARASVTWNPEKGTFSTYAVWWIRQRILNELRKAPVIHLTKGQYDNRLRGEAIDNPMCFSLEAVSDDEDRFGEDGFEKEVIDRCLSEEVAASIRKLPERWQAVIRMTSGIGCRRFSQRETGTRLGISGQRVDQIRKKAIGMLAEDRHLREIWEEAE